MLLHMNNHLLVVRRKSKQRRMGENGGDILWNDDDVNGINDQQSEGQRLMKASNMVSLSNPCVLLYQSINQYSSLFVALLLLLGGHDEITRMVTDMIQQTVIRRL